MANCLLTELGESINNNGIPKLGELLIRINNNSGDETPARFYLGVRTGNHSYASLRSGGTMYGNADMTTSLGTEVDIYRDNIWTNLFFNRGDALGITNKYAISVLYIGNAADEDIELDISQLEYCTLLKELVSYCPNVTGDIKYLANKSYLQTLTLNCQSIYGDISSLVGLTSLTTRLDLSGAVNITGDIDSIVSLSGLAKLILMNCAKVSGDISSLGTFTSADTIDLRGTSVTGSIESLVEAFIAAGKTSGSVALGATNQLITVGGSPVIASGRPTLAWNSEDSTFSYGSNSYPRAE